MATKKAAKSAATKTPAKKSAKAPAKAAAKKAPAKKAVTIHAEPAAKKAPTHEEIAIRAEQLWQERGRPHGSAHEDWHRAQHELTN